MGGHTPGPWSVEGVRVLDDEGGMIADCDRFQYTDDGEMRLPDCEANARLIAAAPSLLDALIKAKQEMWLGARHQWTMSDFKKWAVVQEIDAVLTLADGKPR